MAATRELKGRINSVRSSQKITGAMKMISSARLRKAENALFNARPYRDQLNRLLGRVSSSALEYRSPLAEERTARRVAIVLFASNEGLCGAFNVTLFKKFLEVLDGYARQGVGDVAVYAVGTKLLGGLRKTKGIKLMPVPDAFARKDWTAGCVELADALMRGFLDKEIDRVELIYSRFKGMGSQIVLCEQFLPWKYQGEGDAVSSGIDYIYEPDAGTILDALYPLAVHATMVRALLENQTSEQAARILAMQMANDNAGKLLDDLQLQYNKMRQQAITSELLDIVGGSLK